MARLLRVLARTPGQLQTDGGAAIQVEAGGIVRTVHIPAPVVSAADRAGLARSEGSALTVTPEGRAWLARRAEPEAAFLAQHQPLERQSIRGPEGEAEVLVDAAESPLAWLRRRRGRDGGALLDAAAFAAGERLRADFTRASLMPRVTANWQAGAPAGRRAGGGDLTFSDVVIAARQRVSAAMAAVGPELSGVVLDVCCFLKGLEEVEREHGWPVRSGKVVLVLGLARLARHYGLRAEARGPASGRMRSWSAPAAPDPAD